MGAARGQRIPVHHDRIAGSIPSRRPLPCGRSQSGLTACYERLAMAQDVDESRSTIG